MRYRVKGSRALQAAAVAGVLVMAATGCSSKGVRADFALPADQRPLEIPPPLVLVESAPVNDTSSAVAPAPVAAPVGNANGFTAAGERDAVYARVGQLLEGIDGLQIASRAQLLGSYDVAYQGSNFLVRIVAVDAGAYVSAVDPRGLPATDAAALAVIAQLQAALAN